MEQWEGSVDTFHLHVLTSLTVTVTLRELITCSRTSRRRRPFAPPVKLSAGDVSGSYPRNGHDAQSEQAGSQQVPQAVAVQLQSHGQRHGPQQIQHLHAGDADQ